MILQVGVLVFTTAQRLGELVLARINTRRLLQRGAVEYAPEHYPFIVALHAAWLGGLWWLAPGRPAVWPWLVVFALCQAVRVWTIMALGERWTTRIIVLPGKPLVARGPYRFFPHPNYAVVVVEIAALPLAFGLGGFALAFSLLNAAALWVRIRAEDRALKART